MSDTYILKNNIAFPCADPVEWSDWMGKNQERCVVARTDIGYVRVITVFLGLNHNFSVGGEPHLFETMVFEKVEKGIFRADGFNQITKRYSSWADAIESHTCICKTLGKRFRLAGKEARKITLSLMAG